MRNQQPKRRFGRFGRTGRRDWLWAVTIAVVIIGAGFVGFVVLSGGSSGSEPAIAGVPCESNERLEYHVHAQLQIFIQAQPVEVPANIGIKKSCLYWLHTHDTSGLIHIEAPTKRDFTLGQFFQVWGEPLSQTSLLAKTADGSHEIRATVDGSPFSGDPATIPLVDQSDQTKIPRIVLQYGPPFAASP